MSNTTQAPAIAEGPTQHTQNQAPSLTPVQLRMLHKGIAGTRVRQKQGQSHVEAWDIRRHLIRIFGFGGYSIETIALDLVSQQEIKPGRWTIVYRAQVRLTVYATDGREITHFEDGAAGDASNQPKLGDAHDMAMKTALSQALKRCAVNLGDQFGLGLYNGGKADAVVHFSAAHHPDEWQKDPQPQPEPVDPPVQPEPEPEATQDTTPENLAPEAPAPSGDSQDPVAGAILDKFYAQAKENWQHPGVLTQLKEGARLKGVLGMEVQGLAPERKPMPFEEVLDTLIGRAAAANRERNAA